METIKFKLLHPDAKLPTRAHPADACFDVVATSRVVHNGYIEYGLGFSTEMPPEWVGFFHARSSISHMTDLMLCNSVAVIDAGFRGEWKARFAPRLTAVGVANYLAEGECTEAFNPSKEIFRLYRVGDRIGQIRFAPLPRYSLALVDELNNTSRGTGGFGSTGA